tara:strand:- start:1571 stop:2356 length:786 start_codon:yes stop_codon:yes gene_type:complete
MRCPECDNEKIIAEGDGIMSCESCSLVFDSGPQWMKYKPSNKLKKPEQNVNALPSSRTVLKWQSEVRTNVSLGKNILLASEEINRISELLKLDNKISESGLEIFSSSSKKGIVRGRSTQKVAAASVFTACRMSNLPITLDEIANICSLNRNELSKLHRLIKRKLKLNINISSSITFLSKFTKKLALPKNVETEAKDIIRVVEESEYRQGISPIALLGASIYLACKKTKVRRSQLEIAKTLGTSEVTLRNRAKEIKTLLNSG